MSTAAALVSPAEQLSAGRNESDPRVGFPLVVTDHETVRDMLCMANIGKDDVVLDLGSRDGRIEFHPTTSDTPFACEGGRAFAPVIRDWAPRRIESREHPE